MVTVIVPEQDPRYEDSGRRQAIINGRSYPLRKATVRVVTIWLARLRSG